ELRCVGESEGVGIDAQIDVLSGQLLDACPSVRRHRRFLSAGAWNATSQRSRLERLATTGQERVAEIGASRVPGGFRVPGCVGAPESGPPLGHLAPVRCPWGHLAYTGGARSRALASPRDLLPWLNPSGLRRAPRPRSVRS